MQCDSAIRLSINTCCSARTSSDVLSEGETKIDDSIVRFRTRHVYMCVHVVLVHDSVGSSR